MSFKLIFASLQQKSIEFLGKPVKCHLVNLLLCCCYNSPSIIKQADVSAWKILKPVYSLLLFLLSR